MVEIGIGLVAIVFLCLYLQAQKNNRELKAKHINDIETARQEAITSSRNTVRGQINEELAPLFKEFPYNLADCKFSGSPHDYTIFHNMSAIRDGDKSKQLEIILAEVKVNKARPSIVQKAIKDAVDNGRVRFETWRIKDNQLIIK